MIDMANHGYFRLSEAKECANRLRHSHCCVAHCPLGPDDCKSCQREIRNMFERVSGTQMILDVCASHYW